MPTKMEERQSFIRYYKQQTGTQEVVMKEVAEFAAFMNRSGRIGGRVAGNAARK